MTPAKKSTITATVNRTDALRYLGYSGQNLTSELTERFEAIAHKCETELTPSFCWKILSINESDSLEEGESPYVVLENGLVLPGKSITQHLQGACSIACLACTLGMKCERELHTLAAINPLDAMLYGSCANALIETTAEYAQQAIAHEVAPEGLHARMRFSPGYGDLPLTVQKPFLAELQAQKFIGLTVNKNNLLIPTKSITAVIGLFDKIPPSHTASPCSNCIAREYCSYLEKGITCYGTK